jgi:MFS family permease
METETTSTSSNAPKPSERPSGFLSETFRAFRYRNFAILWSGACVSSIGTWMQKVAQSWLVYQLSNDAFLLGLDAFLGEIPIFIFTMLGGVVADRKDRRKVLIGSQLMQMLSAVTLATLYATGVLEIWHILCLSVVNGLAQAFGGPAYQAIVPALVEKKRPLQRYRPQFNSVQPGTRDWAANRRLYAR